jgi:hypothetical protein
VYLTPQSQDDVLQQMQAARLNEGAIDVWAHTEEVTSAEQIAAWQAVIEQAQRDFWVAPVPEIVQYAQDIRQVTVDVRAEQPAYIFRVHNGSEHDLQGVTLKLPYVPSTARIDGQPVTVKGTDLVLDLQRGETREIVLSSAAASMEARWPV